MRGVLLLLLAALDLAACNAAAPAPGPEARCAEACGVRARACTEDQCARGCRLVLDRLVEREGAHVLACVAKSKPGACDDAAFADCAARSGPYVDGGPAPPKPPSDDDDS